MKKILFIGMTSNYGGLETFMMNIFRRLNNENIQFEFIKEFKNRKMAYEDEILKKGGVIHTVPIPHVGYSIKNLIRRRKVVKSFFKHNDYDVVHLNCLSIMESFWIRAANKYTGVKKCIIHSHIDRNLTRSRIKMIINVTLGKIYQLYVNHKKNIIRLAASKKAGKHMYHSNDFCVVNNGIDVDKYKFSEIKKRKIKSELNIDDDYKIVMTVAKIEYQKNYPKVINVFRRIHSMDKKTVLVVIGKKGAIYSEVISLVRKYNLEKNVVFLGIRKNVNELLSIADLMLMPSLIEAFPFSLVEAQAAGVPAVVSKDVIPKEENITGKLKYISLNNSDTYWAKQCLEIFNHNYDKIDMYRKVCDSDFNLDKSIKLIKKIYFE